MRPPLAFGLVVVLTACRLPDKLPIRGEPDAGADPDVAAALDASLPDIDAAPIDASPDADLRDLTPPELDRIIPEPASSIWLHAPLRVVFDEPLDPASAPASRVTVRVAGSAVTARLSFEAPATLVIALDASVRGTGTVDVRVEATVTDLAGNTRTSTIDATFEAPAWHGVPIDRGLAPAPPSLATDARGNVLAAWVVGGTGSRRAVAAILEGSTWRSLGGTLGTGDVSSAAITLDTNGAPLIAFADSGTVQTARWAANAWQPLASPGSAMTVAIATPPSGAPIVALFGATVALRELVSGAWQPLGSELVPDATIAGEPVLATPRASVAVVGWLDAARQLRVHRFEMVWSAFEPIVVGAGARTSMSARDRTVAVAWDQWSGSHAVLAAIARDGATAWTQLGKPLDVDISGDARQPAIALETGGVPIVAWTEVVEAAQRGVLARWSGSAWTLVGGVTWLASTTAQPAGTRLVLADGVPVVATSTSANITVARFNGPRTPSLGMTTRRSLAGCAFSMAAPPALLSQTGCFDLSRPNQPAAHAGLIPFDVVAELWSDGAKKRRWIALAAGQSLTLSSNGSWAAPVGTFVIKEFALETTPGDPTTRRPIETRFLVNDAQFGWQGFSYRWNTSGTDATQLDDSQLVVDWPMDDGSQHAHFYPARGQCRSCHTPSTGPLLGLRPEQLARWFDYNGVIADQVATLAQLAVAPATTPPAFTAPHDPTASWERRTRGYMAVNCSHCHNPQNIAIKDLRYATPLAQTRLCEVIVPGSPSESVVYQRVTSRPGMPPLGSLRVDPLIRDTLFNWILGMTACP